jgi:hypothetical protein
MQTPTIISTYQFSDLDFVNFVLDAIIADNIITIEEYRLLQSRFKSLYPELIQQFRYDPAELLRMFENDEEIYLEDLEPYLIEGNTRQVLVNIVGDFKEHKDH